jgi:hypothetical protein
MTPTSRVYLRQPARSDQTEFIDLMRASRAFHSPWATAPTDEERFSAYLADARRADFEALLLCRVSDDAILGFFNLSQIVRRGFQSAYLGYAVGKHRWRSRAAPASGAKGSHPGISRSEAAGATTNGGRFSPRSGVPERALTVDPTASSTTDRS